MTIAPPAGAKEMLRAACCGRIDPQRERSVMTPDRARAARELLDFYTEAGVDALVGEAPADRLATARAETVTVDAAAPLPERQPVTSLQPSLLEAPLAAAPVALAPDLALMAAREAARSA